MWEARCWGQWGRLVLLADLRNCKYYADVSCHTRIQCMKTVVFRRVSMLSTPSLPPSARQWCFWGPVSSVVQAWVPLWNWVRSALSSSSTSATAAAELMLSQRGRFCTCCLGLTSQENQRAELLLVSSSYAEVYHGIRWQKSMSAELVAILGGLSLGDLLAVGGILMKV